MSLSQNYPAQRPSLLLNFANSKAIDPRVTFTRASSATYFDSTGVLRSAANNVPRIDYDPVTLAARGLLIEEARTNSFTYSAELGNAAWTPTRSSVTTDATLAPDGTLAGDKLVEDATPANTHFLTSASVSYTSGTVYTISFFAKSDGSGRRIQAVFSITGFGVTTRVNFNVDTQTVTLGTNTTGSITSVGNGWYRCAATMTATATASAGISFALANTNAANLAAATYDGDGTSGIFLWGVQVEAGAFPTSYIPTTASSATRAADVASVGTLSPWYNASEGTLYGEAASTGYVLDTNFPLLTSIDDGTNNNRITISQGSASTGLNTIVRTGGVGTTIADSNVDLSGTPRKIAGAVQGTSVFVSVNGGAVITGTTNGVPSGLTTFRIGSSGGLYLSSLNGHLRTIAYYPTRLTNAQLQSITS